jgi:copper chaperone CopZ
MWTMSLLVDGMRCRRCVREVTARLRDVPGVETVAADARSSRVRVAGTMAGLDVLRALAGLAYPVQVLEEPDVAPDG